MRKIIVSFLLLATAVAAAPAGAQAPPVNAGGQSAGGVDARVKWVFQVGARASKVHLLTANSVPEGGNVVLRCSGRGCSFSKRTLAPTGGRVEMRKYFRHQLRPRATITVRINSAAGDSRVVTFKIRKRTLPLVTSECFAAGSDTATACG